MQRSAYRIICDCWWSLHCCACFCAFIKQVQSALDADRAALDADRAALDADRAALDADRAALDADRAALDAVGLSPLLSKL
jgi:hypothetical protein